jgi:2-dehydro-3-deoxyphosphogluconate aldolase / (4S)-4-hydroxy-2-oxoglutarate aldolase
VRIEEVEARLGAAGVVPVITIDDAQQAPGLGAALLVGGLPVAEITFRTDAAAEAIAALRRDVPGVLVGAGTVLDAATVDRALEAGAEFIVAPGLSPAVVQRCLERDVAVIPGVATPTEIEAAMALGFRLLKLFPAEALGGLPYLGAVAAPYRGVRFMPTGGIGPANLAAWLANPAVVACGGSWIATADDIRAGRWAEVTAKAALAVATVAAARA